MSSILEQLYSGSLCPEAKNRPEQEAYRQMRQTGRRHYEGFCKALDAVEPSLRKQFEQILDDQYALLPFEYAQTFIDGFFLGAGLMIEVAANLRGKAP